MPLETATVAPCRISSILHVVFSALNLFGNKALAALDSFDQGGSLMTISKGEGEVLKAHFSCTAPAPQLLKTHGLLAFIMLDKNLDFQAV